MHNVISGFKQGKLNNLPLMRYWPVFIRLCTAQFFSRQVYCDGKHRCREVLSGVVHLDSDQAFEFETIQIDDLSNTTVALKVEKSPLLIVYDLDYLQVLLIHLFQYLRQDVIGAISEEIYDYSWSAAAGSGVFQDVDFEPNRCSQKSNADLPHVDTDNRLLHGGRVCGCLETGWGSGKYSQVRRSELNCNAWRKNFDFRYLIRDTAAVFRPSSTIWASRHCPKLVDPVYSVYSIRSWRVGKQSSSLKVFPVGISDQSHFGMAFS